MHGLQSGRPRLLAAARATDVLSDKYRGLIGGTHGLELRIITKDIIINQDENHDVSFVHHYKTQITLLLLSSLHFMHNKIKMHTHKLKC